MPILILGFRRHRTHVCAPVNTLFVSEVPRYHLRCTLDFLKYLIIRRTNFVGCHSLALRYPFNVFENSI